MFRTLIWFSYFWLYFIVAIPKLYHANKLKKQGKNDKLDTYLKQLSIRWSRTLLKIAGIQLEVIGKENLSKDHEKVLYVANHQSNFDIPILYSGLEEKLGFIAKKEIKKMPFIGRWMDLMGCIFIDRQDVRQSIKAINQGVKNIKNGQSMVIFPEGTRSKTGQLGEFKPGSLKLATKSQGTIVPVTIDGSIKSMGKGDLTIKPAKVRLVIGKPIKLKPEERDTTVLTKKVKDIIEGQLKGD